jgi:hypothetical protein
MLALADRVIVATDEEASRYIGLPVEVVKHAHVSEYVPVYRHVLGVGAER